MGDSENLEQEEEVPQNIVEALGRAVAASGKKVKAQEFVNELKEKSKQEESTAEKENREIIEMRKIWSHWVLFFIGVILLFDIVTVTLYGLGIWKFQDPNVVIVIVTDNLLKIIGLGIIITHNIFKKIYKEK